MAKAKRKFTRTKQIFLFVAVFIIIAAALIILVEAKKKCQPLVFCKNVYYYVNMTDGKIYRGYQTFCITLAKCSNKYYINAGVMNDDKKTYTSLINHTEIKTLFDR